LLEKKVSAITCGAEYTVAICEEEDEVYSWGW
jgi:alpha-tubulin suppressor-like RCC1 family protein